MASRSDRRARSRQGQVLTITALFSGVLLGSSALVIDIGRAYLVKQQMQGAADAAALAGAVDMHDPGRARDRALEFAGSNGFVHGKDGCLVTTLHSPDGMANRYRVTIERPMGTLLARLVGASSMMIRAQATAEYWSLLPLDINGGGQAGVNGVQTLSVFGPWAPYTYGDPFSVRWLNDGSVNPSYLEDGYNFQIEVPADYEEENGTSALVLEIFDPDTGNAGGGANAGPNAVDEIRYPPGGGHPPLPAGMSATTVTRYRLYAPDNSPNDYSDDTLIAEAFYGQDSSTDMTWVTPDGFVIDVAEHGDGQYRLNVTAVEGSSENGFNFRAGPPGYNYADPDLTPTLENVSILATGYLPMNFNTSGTVTVTLGTIPSEAADLKVHISKFDTDVGAKSVHYEDGLGNTWSGTLSGNGTWKEDVIHIPVGYPGSVLTATYQAGSQDTSAWYMWFEGHAPGQPGRVRLVD